MKKLIIIATMFFGFANAQSDSSYIKLQKQIDHIQLNLQKSHDIYNVGVVINAAGAMVDLMAIIGYNYDFMDRQQAANWLYAGIGFHVVGTSVIFYSHKFIDKASVSLSLTGVRYNF